MSKTVFYFMPTYSVREVPLVDVVGKNKLKTAKKNAEERYRNGQKLVWAENPDWDGQDANGTPCWRILAWESKEDAKNDAGEKSVGCLFWFGERDLD